MEFREFIRKPFVVCEEEQPEVQQPEPEKSRILTPDKKLILPAQPKREKPQGMKDWHPEGRMVDAFPNARNVKPYDNVDYNEFADNSIFGYMEDYAERDFSNFTSSRTFKDRHKKLESMKPEGFKWASNRDEDSPEFKNWRKYNNEFHKMNQYLNRDQIGIQQDSLIGEYTRNMYGYINNYLRSGKIEKVDGDYRNPFQNESDIDNKDDAEALYDRLAYFLDEGIRTQQEYSDMPPRIYHRNLENDPFDKLKIGDVIRDPGIMSTTRNLEGIPWNFGETRMEIFGGKDRYDIFPWLSRYPAEEETLFAPNTELKYIGRSNDGRYKFDQVGFNRDDFNDIMESVKSKPILNKFMKKISKAFQDRMNDFQFQVLTPEKQEEKPESTELDDLIKQIMTSGE